MIYKYLLFKNKVKVFFIPYYKSIPFKQPPFLKKKIRIGYSYPYKQIALNIKKWFEKNKVQTKIFPVTGCLLPKLDIFVGELTFYLDNLLLRNKNFWVFNGKWFKIKSKYFLSDNKNKKNKILNLINIKNNIGIIVSLKKYQNNLSLAFKLKEKLEKNGKKVFIILFDEVNNLEDFNFIELWVNTACPRIRGENIVNYVDLLAIFQNFTIKKENY